MNIVIKNYSKTIKNNDILKNINYTFEDGHIYGLHGRNGSGKTMLLRAIAGLIYPTSGQILIDNKILHEDISFPPSIGVIIENVGLLPYLTAFDNLKTIAKINNIASDDDIKNTLIALGLNPDDTRKLKEYSLGMKQKVAIAQAIFERPQILLLDEPTNALDEESVDVVRKILLDLKNNKTLIIIASHNSDDLNLLSDTIINIQQGKIIDKK